MLGKCSFAIAAACCYFKCIDNWK